MLIKCKDCRNYHDDDMDGIGFCELCNVFVFGKGECEIQPKLELQAIAKRVNMNDVQGLVRSNFSQVNTNGEGQNVS